jgi:DNA repair protein RadC
VTYRRNAPKARIQKVVAILERSTMDAARKVTLATSLDAAEIAAGYIGDRANEIFIAMFINIRNQFLGFTEFTEGSAYGVTVNAAGLFKDALLVNAAGIVTAHQHPTGDPAPSADDGALWARLTAIGELLGIPVVDNLVIGTSRYWSDSAKTYESYVRGKPVKPWSEA